MICLLWKYSGRLDGVNAPEILIRVVSILPALLALAVSKNAGYPLRLILDRLTLTNSRLMDSESFLPVTDVLSSSTAPNTRIYNSSSMC